MSATTFPEPFIIQPTQPHLYTVILLHGRNSTGLEFANELFESQDSTGRTLTDRLPGYRWVFPSARPLWSHTFREDLNQWYDIESLNDPERGAKGQVSGMKESITYLRGIVQREADAVPSGRIVLGGISQGFSIAVLTTLTETSSVAALVGFSSWLPFCTGISDVIVGDEGCQTGANTRRAVAVHLGRVLKLEHDLMQTFPSIPVFLAHCVDDDMVDIELGRKLKDTLSTLRHSVTWIETSEGGHWINEPRGIDELISFLSRNQLV